jgi:hypothetical protein
MVYDNNDGPIYSVLQSKPRVSLDCWICSHPGQDNQFIDQISYVADPARGIPAPNQGESCPDYQARVKALGIPGWDNTFTLHDTYSEVTAKCPPLPNWEWVGCEAGKPICQEAPQGPFISRGDCESFYLLDC